MRSPDVSQILFFGLEPRWFRKEETNHSGFHVSSSFFFFCARAFFLLRTTFPKHQHFRREMLAWSSIIVSFHFRCYLQLMKTYKDRYVSIDRTHTHTNKLSNLKSGNWYPQREASEHVRKHTHAGQHLAARRRMSSA